MNAAMVDTEQMRAHVRLVRELSNGLAAHIHTLPDDVWRNAEQYGSPCAGWKLADVITHLIWGANLTSLSIARALKGQTAPPMGYSPMTPEESTESIISLRDAYDEDLFPEFNASCRRLNSMLVSLELEQFDAPAFHPTGVMTVAGLIGVRALELAVHGWDVRYTMDRSATIHPSAILFLIRLLPLWFRAGFRKGDRLASPIIYGFRLNEPAGQGYDVVVTGDGFSLQPSGDGDADVTFGCDADTYVLFGMGRLPFARAVRRGRLSFEGDEKLAAQFTDWFGPV